MNSILNQLDQQILNKHLLKHEFYLAWTKGELSQDCLKEYAKEYYHHVKAFPTYLSAIHSHTEDQETRRHLLQNLIDEEAGNPNHPQLWKSFAQGLGATEKEIAEHTPCREIQELIGTFRQLCLQGSVAEGLAALYAYESQIPEICESKIKGLKQHYGMTQSKQWEYFSVHIAADKEHAAVERALLAQVVSEENRELVQEAARQVLQKLWNFLSGLCERHQIACSS